MAQQVVPEGTPCGWYTSEGQADCEQHATAFIYVKTALGKARVAVCPQHRLDFERKLSARSNRQAAALRVGSRSR